MSITSLKFLGYARWSFDAIALGEMIAGASH